MVGLDRLELSTSPLSGVRSNHLSYRPVPTYPVGQGLCVWRLRPKALSAKKEKRGRQNPLCKGGLKSDSLRPIF